MKDDMVVDMTVYYENEGTPYMMRDYREVSSPCHNRGEAVCIPEEECVKNMGLVQPRSGNQPAQSWLVRMVRGLLRKEERILCL